MRQRISYDSSDYAGSVIIWIIIIGCFFFFFWWATPTQDYNNYSGWYWGGSSWWWWIVIFFLVFWWICALCYAPLGVDVDDDEVRIRRPFKSRRIKMSDIESVAPYEVSKKAKGKFLRTSPVRAFGKWGHYSDDKIGDYFAYYGKPDNTVLITLKDGRKYVVGGSNAKELSDYINGKLNQ